MKHKRIFGFFKYFFLTVMILEMIFLCVQALLPGDESAKTSGAVSDALDDILTDASGEIAADVAPREIAICANREQTEDLRLAPAEEVRLSLAFTPDDTSVRYRKTHWTSADETIVKMHGGTAEAVGIGETTVYAALDCDPAIRARVKVTVAEVALIDFALKTSDGQEECTLQAGQAVLLVPELFPADATASFLYESEDPAIARVSPRGAVEGVSEGETAVTATYVSPTDPADRWVRRIPVRVTQATEPCIPVTGVKLACDSLTLADDGTYRLYVGDTGAFSARFAPENTTQTTLLFESSGDALQIDRATGRFEAIARGEATVTVRAANGTQDTLSVKIVSRELGGFTLQGGTLKRLDETRFTATVKAGAADARFLFVQSERYFKFSSDNAEIAEVYEDGVVAAYRSSKSAENGVVVLTVTLSDNEDFSDRDGDLSQTYTIYLTVERQTVGDTIPGFSLLIRKLFGHFGAFLVLGVLTAVVAIFFDRGKWKGRLLTLGGITVFGFTFACFTELLQMDIFTSGRAAAFSDVIIDCSGFLPAALAVYGIFLLVLLILAVRRAVKNKKAAQKGGTGAQGDRTKS